MDPTNCLTWAPHATKTFTLGFAPDHYQLLRFWNKLTGGCLTTGTYALYPAYCKVPTISEGDRGVMAAAEILDCFKTIVPKNTNKKVQHCNVIDKLTNTLSEYQTPQRVVTQTMQAQRVSMTPPDSHAPTSRNVVRAAPQIHQRKTRRNSPFKEIEGEVQAGQDPATQETPGPAMQTPPVQDCSTNENVPPPTLLIQPTLHVMPMIKTKRKKGKNSGH